MLTYIIDVDHQAISLATLRAMRAQGLVAVIAKATEGHDFVDRSFPQWRDLVASINAEEREAGSTRIPLLFAAYHFLTHSTPGDVQASWFEAHVHPDVFPILDWEWSKYGNGTRSDVEMFLEHALETFGRVPMIYTSRQYVHEVCPRGIPDDSIIARAPLWAVHYGDGPPPLPLQFVGERYVAGPWRRADLVQYTDVKWGPRDQKTYPRDAPGAGKRKFDRSVFFGDEATLAEFWRDAGRNPGPRCIPGVGP